MSLCAISLFLIRTTGRSKKKVHFSFDKIRPCMFIWSRLGFYECLSEQVTHYPRMPKTKNSFRGANDAILELTKVTEDEDIDTIIKSVRDAIRINTTYSQSQISDIAIMVSEMLQNIFLHSCEERPTGLIAIQKYQKFNYVQMVIADPGIPVTIKYACLLGSLDGIASSQACLAGLSVSGA